MYCNTWRCEKTNLGLLPRIVVVQRCLRLLEKSTSQCYSVSCSNEAIPMQWTPRIFQPASYLWSEVDICHRPRILETTLSMTDRGTSPAVVYNDHQVCGGQLVSQLWHGHPICSIKSHGCPCSSLFGREYATSAKVLGPLCVFVQGCLGTSLASEATWSIPRFHISKWSEGVNINPCQPSSSVRILIYGLHMTLKHPAPSCWWIGSFLGSRAGFDSDKKGTLIQPQNYLKPSQSMPPLWNSWDLHRCTVELAVSLFQNHQPPADSILVQESGTEASHPQRVGLAKAPSPDWSNHPVMAIAQLSAGICA